MPPSKGLDGIGGDADEKRSRAASAAVARAEAALALALNSVAWGALSGDWTPYLAKVNACSVLVLVSVLFALPIFFPR